MEKNNSYWYCPNCKEELDGCHVTHQELCEYCGTSVLSVPESMSQKRLEEIIAAESDGRLAVLPCKVGDMVYKVYNTRGCKNCTRSHTTCDGITCPEPKVYEGKFNYSDLDDLQDIYLTREAAEKALGGAEDGK